MSNIQATFNKYLLCRTVLDTRSIEMNNTEFVFYGSHTLVGRMDTSVSQSTVDAMLIICVQEIKVFVVNPTTGCGRPRTASERMMVL